MSLKSRANIISVSRRKKLLLLGVNGRTSKNIDIMVKVGNNFYKVQW